MRWRSLGVLVATGLSFGCSQEVPLATGLSEALKARVIERTIEHIELSDTFTPENFEQRQRRHFESMTADMAAQAVRNLPTRIERITGLQIYREAVIDRASAELVIRRLEDERARVSVRVRGSNRYRSEGGLTRTQQVEWNLPWILTEEGGDIVMRHEGIRMTVL